MIGTMQITTSGVRSTLLLAIGLLAVSGCVYEMPIQQGNYLDATALVQVKKGMTRAQVRYLLGTPMVPGGFDNDRWDYDYYLKLRQLKAPRRARAAVYFHNDLVDHVDSDVMPVSEDVAATTPSGAPATSQGSATSVAPGSDQTSAPASTPAAVTAAPASEAPSDPATLTPAGAVPNPPSS